MTAFILIEEIPEPGCNIFSQPEKIFRGYTISQKKAEEWLAIMRKRFKNKDGQTFFYIQVESLEDQDFKTYIPDDYTKMYMNGHVIK